MKDPSEAVLLIVDDQEVNRYSTGRILRGAGYTVIEAENGQEGIAKAASDPDLILLDVNLPDIDGFRVCREIRSRPRTARIPIIHISATFTSDADRAHGLDEGADGYLTRPVEPRVLIATVRACLRARRAEDAVRRRERELQSLADNTPDILARFDREGRQLFVSAAIEVATNRPVADFLGKTNRELGMPTNLCDRWEAALAQVFETGKLQEIDFRFESPTGTRYFSSRLVPEFDTDGTVENVLGVTRDVTDRRQSELKVQESELKFRTLANSISQLAWMARTDGYVSWYNDRWLDYTGLTLEGMLERGWETVLDPAEAERVTTKIRLHFASGEPWEDTFPLRRRDGTYRSFLSRMLPVRDEDGGIRLWFGTNTDIEELRLAEQERQKFVSLVESSTDFVATYDLEGKPLYVNRAGMGMVGMENMDEARSIGLDDLILAEDRDRLRGEFLPAVLRDGHAEVEVRVRHLKTGELLWVNCHLFANKDEMGRTTAYSTVSREVTDRKRLETNLRQVASDLSEANRRQFQFLATLAHELRNPLAPILTGLELIRKSVEHPMVIEEARGMMERQTRHMVRLIDDLLDLSRITQGKLNLRRSRVELAPIVRNAVESIQPFIDNARHRLEVKMPSGHLFLNADPNRLAQVVANILSNAAKYTPNGGRIALMVEAEGPEVVIRVKDNGIGIPPGMQHRVFEMFVQIERPNESGYTGLGIGLTLVRQIVQMHGGSIEVVSEGENRGTEFTVRMPLLLEPTFREEPGPRIENAPDAPARRILIVDDNRDAAETMSLILQILGNDVRLAYDGLEAVQKAEQFRPAVVLMDIGMPRLNGYEAAKRIREQSWGKGMTLVALTGWGQEEDKEKTRAAGFDYHLTKPAEPEVIRDLLAKIR